MLSLVALPIASHLLLLFCWLARYAPSPQFVSETGSQGQWNRPSAGEIASDFANFNPDGSVREGVYDHTKLPEFPEEEASEGKKGRKAKQVAEE